MELFTLILSTLMFSLSLVLISNISKKNKEYSVSLYRQIGACIFSIPLLFFLGFNFLELSHHLLNIVLLSLFGSLNIGFTF